MKWINIVIQLISIYFLLWSLVVTHLIFNSGNEIQFFIWIVDRDTIFEISMVLIPIAFILQFYLSVLIFRKHSRHRNSLLVSFAVSGIILVIAIAILQYTLIQNADLALFDISILLICASLSGLFIISQLSNYR